ncbi:Hypothetical protein D9617_33g038220 [Elsinoe fawcettii]|nr:Hypothetical protein D9617_33g038220 [Elsinoe fawcettii]
MKHDVDFFDVTGKRVWTRMTVTQVLKDDPEKQRLVVRAHPVFTLEEDAETMFKIREAFICAESSVVKERVAQLRADAETA